MNVSLNSNQIVRANSYTDTKNNDLKNKISSIVSQVSGNVKNVDIKYNNDNSISKAVITVVVSENEAKNIVSSSNSSNNIEIKIIIDKTIKDEIDKTHQYDSTYETSEKDDVVFNEENNDSSKLTYSYTLGPDGKMYVTLSNNKKNLSKPIDPVKQFNLYDTSNKNLEKYKRYNFKNIQTLEKKDSSRFSLNV